MRSMHTLITVILVLGLSGALIFGLLHVMQELIARTTPPLPAVSDCPADRDEIDAERN